MENNDLGNILDMLNDKTYDLQVSKNVWNMYICKFDTGFSDGISIDIDGNEIQCYSSEDSDRGWNEDNDDYERTIEEQIIFELKEFREKLNQVIEAIEK
jgi:hypothetical protein